MKRSNAGSKSTLWRILGNIYSNRDVNALKEDPIASIATPDNEAFFCAFANNDELMQLVKTYCFDLENPALWEQLIEDYKQCGNTTKQIEERFQDFIWVTEDLIDDDDDIKIDSSVFRNLNLIYGNDSKIHQQALEVAVELLGNGGYQEDYGFSYFEGLVHRRMLEHMRNDHQQRLNNDSDFVFGLVYGYAVTDNKESLKLLKQYTPILFEEVAREICEDPSYDNIHHLLKGFAVVTVASIHQDIDRLKGDDFSKYTDNAYDILLKCQQNDIKPDRKILEYIGGGFVQAVRDANEDAIYAYLRSEFIPYVSQEAINGAFAAINSQLSNAQGLQDIKGQIDAAIATLTEQQQELFKLQGQPEAFAKALAEKISYLKQYLAEIDEAKGVAGKISSGIERTQTMLSLKGELTQQKVCSLQQQQASINKQLQQLQAQEQQINGWLQLYNSSSQDQIFGVVVHQIDAQLASEQEQLAQVEKEINKIYPEIRSILEQDEAQTFAQRPTFLPKWQDRVSKEGYQHQPLKARGEDNPFTEGFRSKYNAWVENCSVKENKEQVEGQVNDADTPPEGIQTCKKTHLSRFRDKENSVNASTQVY